MDLKLDMEDELSDHVELYDTGEVSTVSTITLMSFIV